MHSARTVHYRLECLDRHELLDEGERGFTLANPSASRPALLRAVYDDPRFAPRSGEPGIFRYRAWLPVRRSLGGAGGAVARRSDSLARHLGMDALWLIFSGYRPEIGATLETCSFKELEALSVLARIPEGESRSLVVASAGNTGRSFLQVASRYGFRVTVVVPERALSAIWTTVDRARQARLVALGGGADYYDAIALAELIAAQEGFYPEGGARNVARRDGMGSTLLAAAEAMGEIPAHYVQAVGSGTGGIGAWEMAMRLRAAGLGGGGCRLHLVQNEPFTPMVDAWRAGSRELHALEPADARRRIEALYAPVLSNRKPPYGIVGGVFDALAESLGEMYAVSREEAVAAGELHERLEGCDLDPAAAVALAGMIRALDDDMIGRSDTVVLNLTGGGRRLLDAEGRIRPASPDIVFSPREVNARDVARKLAKEAGDG
jgi:cysteate synthase